MANTKLVKVGDPVAKLSTTNRRPPAAGKGRKPGAKNKATKALKEMILGALDKSGGEEYLIGQARTNPSAFMQLIGKVLPTELKNADEGGFIVHVTTGVARQAE